MADGVGFSPGSGATISTDDAGAAGHVQIIKLAISADGSATVIPADATYGLDVDVTQVVPGTGATNLGKAEDAAHTSGDVGVMALAIRDDTAGVFSGAEGDYEPLHTDASGMLRVSAVIKDSSDAALSFAAPAVLSVTTTDAETTSLDSGDSIHTTILSFTNAAVSAGGTGHIVRALLVDADDQGIEADLYLFSGSVTVPAKDTAWSLSDADAAKLIDTITFSTYEDHVNNRTSVVRPSPPIPYVCDATTLYGHLVTRGTPTYTATGLTVKLQVIKD